METEKSNLPEYYRDYLSEKEQHIRKIESEIRHGDHFIFLTDYHTGHNTGNSPALIRHLLGHTDMTHCFFGGDAVGSAKKIPEMLENQAAFLKLFDFMQPAFYPVIGNHEYYVDMFHRESPKPSAEQEFDTWCSHLSGQIGERGPMGSYMLLRPAERVCYITVPCGFDCEITQELVAWLPEVFLRIPEGYTCIVIGHAFTFNDDPPYCIREEYRQICDALDALNQGQIFAFGGKRYDFSGERQRTVAGIFSGHTHDDECFRTFGGIPLIVTTTDAWEAEMALKRIPGTLSEQAFDAVDIDFDRRMIHLTRIGAGENRCFSY